MQLHDFRQKIKTNDNGTLGTELDYAFQHIDRATEHDAMAVSDKGEVKDLATALKGL